jgi:hypothetical protein
MVSIDLNTHDLAVINGGLGVLCKQYPTPSEKNDVQGTINHVQQQLDEILEWQKIWKEMNPVLKEEINVKVGRGLQDLEHIINNLVIDDELKNHLKKVVMRIEFK